MLWEELDRLTPEYRQGLLLDHFEDYPQQDIARFLGFTLSMVKWRLLRARQSQGQTRRSSLSRAAPSPRASLRTQPIQVHCEGLSLAVERKEEPRKVYLPCAAAKRSSDF